MVAAKTKKSSVKTQPKPTRAVVAHLRRRWRMYLAVGLAVFWAVIAFRLYTSIFAGSAPLPGREPHPLVDVPQLPLPSFWPAFLTSLVPFIPLALCVLSLALIRPGRWSKVLIGVQVVAILGLVVHSHATLLWQHSFHSVGTSVSAKNLDAVIARRAQCGDAVRMVEDYSLGAKTFYELKDRGYHLKTTYDSPTGMLDSDAACATYYDIRSHYPGDHIVLQIFTVNPDGSPAPYLYKFAGQNTVRYGIFIKE